MITKWDTESLGPHQISFTFEGKSFFASYTEQDAWTIFTSSAPWGLKFLGREDAMTPTLAAALLEAFECGVKEAERKVREVLGKRG